jgi:16S rRNA (guanine(966)-N(2))-methyltransferase RsmD
MRVIAGSLKGRRLYSPDWNGLRPTSDSLRETLFNVLAPRLADALLLDGYAGTGAVGIEAFSRGARLVAFVDRDPRAQRLIARNVEHCGIPRGCVIIRSDFDRLDQFDIVVLDPPYDDQPEQVILGTAHLVAPGGMLVLEHARRQPGPDAVRSLTRTRRIAAGDSALSFYEQPASQPSGARTS